MEVSIDIDSTVLFELIEDKIRDMIGDTVNTQVVDSINSWVHDHDFCTEDTVWDLAREVARDTFEKEFQDRIIDQIADVERIMPAMLDRYGREACWITVEGCRSMIEQHVSLERQRIEDARWINRARRWITRTWAVVRSR